MDCLILQVATTELTVAHFGVTRGATELIGAASIELNGERTLAEAIGGVAEKIVGSPRVVLCLSPALFAQRSITLPFNDMRKVREVLPAHLQGECAMPIDELSLGVMAAGTGRFLALWALKRDIGEAISRFRDAGLEPQVITALPFAYGELPGIPADCFVCDGTILALIRGGKLSYFRTFNTTPTGPMIAATLAALELSGGELPTRLCLIGAAAVTMAPDSLPLAAEVVAVPTDLGKLFKNEETFQQLAGHYAVARACFAGRLPDFRQGEHAWTAGDAKLRRKLVLTGLLATGIMVLLLAQEGLKYRAVTTDLAAVNKSIAAMYREIFPTRSKAVDEVAEIKGEIKKLSGVESTGSYLDVLKIVAEAKGNTINGLYEAEYEGRTIRIKGDARSNQAVNEFKAALMPLMASVELGEVKSRPDGMVGFTLTGTMKETNK